MIRLEPVSNKNNCDKMMKLLAISERNPRPLESDRDFDNNDFVSKMFSF